MDVKQTRLLRLRQIINDRFGGVAGQCADHLGMKRPQLSRWITKNEEARQGISDESAREIEEKLGYPRWWMDNHAEDKAQQQPGNYNANRYTAMNQEERDLLDGFRVAGHERREDMLESARRSIKIATKTA